MPPNSIPKNEQAIYTQLETIRAQLAAVKQDRSKFIQKEEIYATYEAVLGIRDELSLIRDGADGRSNRVDAIFDDVCQLLSLCFVTAGLVNTAPATYASLSTVHRLLEHLSESGIYTLHDLTPIKMRLEEVRKIVGASPSDHTRENHFLEHKLRLCQEAYDAVERKTHDIPALAKVAFDELVDLRQCLYSLASRPASPAAEEVEPLRKRLSIVAAARDAHGRFAADESPSDAVMNGLLDDCQNLVDDLAIEQGRLDPELQAVCARLVAIKTALGNLLVTRRWTLRGTDLYYYQKELQEIDEERKAKPQATAGVAVVLYLLRRCYALTYVLLESCEPVSEALQPLHNQLSTLRRCLLEVKRMGGISSARELYPYQMKLASLDNLREDGKFMVNGQIPDGQGGLIALLSECYEICDEMKVDLETMVESGERKDEGILRLTEDDVNDDGYHDFGRELRYDTDDEDDELYATDNSRNLTPSLYDSESN